MSYYGSKIVAGTLETIWKNIGATVSMAAFGVAFVYIHQDMKRLGEDFKSLGKDFESLRVDVRQHFESFREDFESLRVDVRQQLECYHEKNNEVAAAIRAEAQRDREDMRTATNLLRAFSNHPNKIPS